MALSPPVKRKHLHTRSIEINGYEREDGLWDMEGSISDYKPVAYGKMEERRDDGMVHKMHVRLTIDMDFVIRKAEAWSEITPYEICKEVNPNFSALEGLRIGPGFNRKARERVGGTAGCTHIVELLPQMGTATMQTLWPVIDAMGSTGESERRPSILNTCHSWAEYSPVVEKRYPRFYRPKPEDPEAA
ncbi:MAG: DUF2889 domain-containing protein [Minwuia sp.]|uniref:DUF2889 domain-containing protein n=1 Tax=Minwuia sp. TaxID=2493630 RepID=UPI003A87882D